MLKVPNLFPGLLPLCNYFFTFGLRQSRDHLLASWALSPMMSY
jgi:hypothetical protein